MHRCGEINRPSRHWCPLGDPDDCSFHFYDLNPSSGFAITMLFQQVSSTYQTHARHSQMQCIKRSIVWSDLFIYTH